jgi:hypothetical protein
MRRFALPAVVVLLIVAAVVHVIYRERRNPTHQLVLIRPGMGSPERRGIAMRAMMSSAAQPLPLKSRRSLAVTDKEILQTFLFFDLMSALALQSGDPAVTALSLFQQWWSTQGTGRTPPDCQTTLFIFPYCSRAERGLAGQDPFQLDTPASFIAIGLFYRPDLAAEDGTNCGEVRILFARASGVTDK